MKREFNYRWDLANAKFTKDKGKVFSCFACGGGSTMGYKLAGYDVVGCNEIDPKLIEIYKLNHNPKYAFCEPIQTFKLREDLPKELYELDILDGSPPCSNFSMAGNREKDWGKNKKFREGQAEQVLDTLFFDFIDLANKLQPKVVVAENVKGLLLGNAIDYVRRIYEEFDKAGYYCQHWLFNAADMGVPQKRERVFFVCLRKDLAKPFLEAKDFFTYVPKIELAWNMRYCPYSEIEDDDNPPLFENPAPCYKPYWEQCKEGETCSQYHPKGFFHGCYKIDRTKPLRTICGNNSKGRDGAINPDVYRMLTKNEVLLASSFPLDFVCDDYYYICGMSVPPLMTANISNEIHNQWLSKINNK